MGWPQIVWIVLAGISVGMHLVKHGESRQNEKYNVIACLIATGFMAFVLSAGGFFGPTP